MMNASNKNWFFFLFLCFGLYSCNKPKQSVNEGAKLIMMDVVNNSDIDSLLITDKSGVTSVSIKYNNKEQEIIKILPLISMDYKLLEPHVENVYFEANYIQTDDKGFRIKVRNTDLRPDCYFIDLYYENEWYIKSVGVISTQDSVYIKKKNINMLVSDVCNDDLTCNIKRLVEVQP